MLHFLFLVGVPCKKLYTMHGPYHSLCASYAVDQGMRIVNKLLFTVNLVHIPILVYRLSGLHRLETE